VVLGAQNAHLELTNSDKAVVVAVFEVNEAHGRTWFAGLPIFADAGVFQQQVQSVLVILDQPLAGKVRGKLLDDVLNLVILQPRIDSLELSTQYR